MHGELSRVLEGVQVNYAHLNRSIASVGDLYSNPLSPSIQFYRFSIRGGDKSSRLAFILVRGFFEWWEVIFRWYWKVATVQSFAEISFIATDGLVDSDQMRAGRKRAFDLELPKCRQNTGANVSAS